MAQARQGPRRTAPRAAQTRGARCPPARRPPRWPSEPHQCRQPCRAGRPPPGWRGARCRARRCHGPAASAARCRTRTEGSRAAPAAPGAAAAAACAGGPALPASRPPPSLAAALHLRCASAGRQKRARRTLRRVLQRALCWHPAAQPCQAPGGPPGWASPSPGPWTQRHAGKPVLRCHLVIACRDVGALVWAAHRVTQRQLSPGIAGAGM